MALTETQSVRSIEVTTPGAAEPVSVAEAKAFLRVDHNDDDALIGALITASREVVERNSGLALVTQTVTERMPYQMAMDGIELGRTPATSITSVSYYDTTPTLNAIAAADYTARTDSEPGTLRITEGQTDPDTTRGDCVVVVYVVGFASAASVPESINTAILMMVSHLYENRSWQPGQPAEGLTMPATISHLLEPHHIYDL